MIAVPIGPRIQRFASGASPSYLASHGQPEHPRDLFSHICIRSRFSGRSLMPWEFEREGDVVRIDPPGSLVVQAGGGSDLGVLAAIEGTGIVSLFEDWLRPHFQSGALIPVLEPWWLSFSGPFLYYPGRRLVPAPLRAFIDFVKAMPAET
jgi:DNA-binding transcriptional LysR family regulator